MEEPVIGNGGLVGEPLLDNKNHWYSLERMHTEEDEEEEEALDPKKLITRSSIRSWLASLFANGFRTSDLSLRKNCNYSDLQSEKESIV